ncbi:MAG: nitroreductase/quinone reductase family protein [Microbacterium sp.]|uniref:nitroreductase/quinone reductase family protein n=1 Tax=Microbacterium sp. TaxID=51671 RepID=UPI002637AEEA|nr:nitroreductase/quinone reductase family protein [Microbacterium sp.]MCX6501753.1 nitroreductase/quinone reductase family protein [Microbacterium sp.]
MSDWNQQIIEQFRANGGTVDRFGDKLVLLHHIGARSGVERLTPVMAIREDTDTWLIAASKAGAPDNPAWFHNLLAHPDVDIETPEGVVPVRATRLEGEERDAAWARFTTASPGFKAYEEKTDRVIPVLALRRR